MAVALARLPNYLVIEPTSTVRIDLKLDAPSCQIDVALDNPRPGRSFVLLLGPPRGPFVQRVRLAGRARIHFDPHTPGNYTILLANPQPDPIVVRLKVRALGAGPSRARRRPSKRRRRVAARSPTRPGKRARAEGAAKARSGIDVD